VRRLNRASVASPSCLAKYRPGRDNWDDLDNEDRIQIRQRLEQMQGRYCAYCEGALDALGQHIEHFRRKRQFQGLTFTWSNLYWSCDQKDSCGHYKDHGAGPYDVNDLIEPSTDDPDTFFRFRADGTISVRYGLEETEAHKAAETLRVFNLNPQWGRLRQMRKAALSGYVRMIDDCEGFSANELQELLGEELAQAATQPFSTAIRHVLTEP
jgi:uncharacterized protein (TIGR02646 family)